ncbi:MAG: O-antigen ligase family protein [Niabella sp.]
MEALSLKKILWVSMVIISCLLLFSKYYSFGNEYFFVLVSVLFINVALGFISNKRFLYAIPVIIMAVWFIQLYIGMQQWLDAKNYGDVIALVVNGTLQNSGVYACYLVVHLPFLGIFSSLFSKERRKENIWSHPILYWVGIFLLPFLFILCCFLVYQTQSRTAYIALPVTITGWLFLKKRTWLLYKIKQQPRIIFFVGVGVILIIAAVVLNHLFEMKKMSAMGRLMRTEIALQHIADQFWLGTGIGRFSWYYPQWQVQYFKETPDPPKDYFLSADESYIIFNEYLQWFETVGIVGAGITFFLLICFFKAKSENHRPLLNTLKLIVVVIMICGFTTYPLHINTFLLLLAFCFVAVLKLSDSIPSIPLLKRKKTSLIKNRATCALRRAFLALGILLWGLSGYKGITELIAAQQWQQMRDGYIPQIHIEERYAEWYIKLKDNGKFLTEYSIALTRNANNQLATKILTEAQLLFISRVSIEATAAAYSKQKDYLKAIDCWLWVCYYLPNKFVPKYELLKLYQSTNDIVNIKRVASTIITMPVKIPSVEVNKIKQEASNILKELR